jgi:hypothetical protein
LDHQPEDFYRSYLVAFLVVLGLSLVRSAF